MDPWQQHWSSQEPNSEPQDCYQESWASETGKEEARPDKTIKSVHISCTHSRGWEFWHAQRTEDITEEPRLPKDEMLLRITGQPNTTKLWGK